MWIQLFYVTGQLLQKAVLHPFTTENRLVRPNSIMTPLIKKLSIGSIQSSSWMRRFSWTLLPQLIFHIHTWYFEMAVSNETKRMDKTFPRHAQEFFPHSQKHLTTALCILRTSTLNPHRTQLREENQVEVDAISSSWLGINKHLAAEILIPAGELLKGNHHDLGRMAYLSATPIE